MQAHKPTFLDRKPADATRKAMHVMAWFLELRFQQMMARKCLSVVNPWTQTRNPPSFWIYSVWVGKLEESTRERQVTRKTWFPEGEDLYLLNSGIYTVNYYKKKQTKFIECILIMFTTVLSDNETEEFNNKTLHKQETITRSVQLSYFLATAFLQVELFLDMPFPLKLLFLVMSASKSE